jgi:hypothetical protein
MVWIDLLPRDSKEHEILKNGIINILSLGSIGFIKI